MSKAPLNNILFIVFANGFSCGSTTKSAINNNWEQWTLECGNGSVSWAKCYETTTPPSSCLPFLSSFSLTIEFKTFLVSTYDNKAFQQMRNQNSDNDTIVATLSFSISNTNMIHMFNIILDLYKTLMIASLSLPHMHTRKGSMFWQCCRLLFNLSVGICSHITNYHHFLPVLKHKLGLGNGRVFD